MNDDQKTVTFALDEIERDIKSRGMFASVVVTHGSTVGIRLCIPEWSMLQGANQDHVRRSVQGESAYRVKHPESVADGAMRAGKTLEALYAVRRALTDHAHGVAVLINEVRTSLSKMGFRAELKQTDQAHDMKFTALPDREDN